MRDFVTCFSENALQITEATCVPNISSSPSSSILNMVTCLYQIDLYDQYSRSIAVSWCKNSMGQGLSVNLDDDPSSRQCTCSKIDAKSLFSWKKRGSKTLEISGGSSGGGILKIEVYWDLMSAKFGSSSPEPVKGYFVIVVFNGKIVLFLGDKLDEGREVSNCSSVGVVPELVLLSRKEHVAGKSLYATRAQFAGGDRPHDIVIECREPTGDYREAKLMIRIDKKLMVQVKRLLWKFRGNEMIVVDGLHVEMFWDVHGWFFNPASGHAVFMFRTRRNLNKPWLSASSSSTTTSSSSATCVVSGGGGGGGREEEEVGFNLFIYAWKSL